MSQLVFAAKVTHIPRMVLSELPGPLHGCRADAIEGLEQIGQRVRASGATSVVILDTHWLSNAAYHVNGGATFRGKLTSSEFPTQLTDFEYDHCGNPSLADALAAKATERGVPTISHHNDSLGLEYGTLVPMHFMKLGRDIKVVSVSGWCAYSTIEESRRVGAAFREAIEAGREKVAIVASGSFSHRIHDNAVVFEKPYEISDEFYRQCDLRAMELWQTARWKEFTAMLPTYAKACYGEGWMHDTAMLLAALGWDRYEGRAEMVTPYFVASGTGQANVVLPPN
ncbi:MAG: 3,4-dihydroxyphenylacetate 2,3-dioxygenase [Burkholderiales bacterium]|nr:3,4-dihydroxyphenylacetate 2,3-dioxygenase [Burkholderiales bacterium]